MFGLADGQADITFPMMMMVQKLTMFAWNVHDGRMKVEVSWTLLDRSRVCDCDIAERQDLDASQLATRLSHVPSPLPFLGYW
jgi:lysophospholipid acyltransferase